MNDFQLTKPTGWALQAAMLVCFSLMGIYWVRIVQFGNFSLEAYHVGLLTIILVSCASIYSPPAIVRVVIRCTPWFPAYVLYLLVLLPAMTGSSASGLMLKQALFVTGFLCIAAFFSRTREPAGILRKFSLLGIVLYFVFTEYSAQHIGKSLAGAIAEFLASGSFKTLIFGFFRPVFNSLSEGEDLAFVASLTNSIAVSLLVLCLCYRAGYRKAGIDLSGMLLALLILLLCILLNARSVVLAALLSFGLAFAIKVFRAKTLTLAEMLFWSAIAALAVMASFILATMNSSATQAIIKVFQFTDNSAESRLDQYSFAFGLIDERLFLGSGYVETANGLPIHNLFLSSWAYSGIAGFVFVLIFYIGLAVSGLRWLYRALVDRDYWVLNIRLEWVAVLPVLPLFRVWLSGAGGQPAFGEWVALGVFVGLTMRNDTERLIRNQAASTRVTSVFKSYKIRGVRA